MDDDARHAIVARAGGDARSALNLLEAAALATADGAAIETGAVEGAAGGRAIPYDRAGDAHYDTISAFIKSMRGSDPDAAVYYLAVMIAGGEDPKFIARRIVIAASEDVGNADPQALVVATAAARAVEFVGLPECRINLAQAAVYIALAPKSDASYRADRRGPGTHRAGRPGTPSGRAAGREPAERAPLRSWRGVPESAPVGRRRPRRVLASRRGRRHTLFRPGPAGGRGRTRGTPRAAARGGRRRPDPVLTPSPTAARASSTVRP